MGPSGKLKPVSTLLMLHLNSQVLGTKGSVCPAPWLWRRWLRRWLVQKEALALSHCRTDGECCLLEHQETHRVCVLLLCSCFLPHLVIIPCLAPP